MVKELGTEVITGEYTQSYQSPEEVNAEIAAFDAAFTAEAAKLAANADKSAPTAIQGIDAILREIEAGPLAAASDLVKAVQEIAQKSIG